MTDVSKQTTPVASSGFSTRVLSLSDEEVSSPFGKLRNGCPHKGTDFTSSKRPREFTAGVYGKVVNPSGGDWGTITVTPFQSASTCIQYLHCSRIDKHPGATVAPWTVLGATGETAPAGRIDGIHLHLQVCVPGNGQSCWKGRNFTNPETWPIQDLLVGTYYDIGEFSHPSGTAIGADTFVIGSTAIGSTFTQVRTWKINFANGCIQTERWEFRRRIIRHSGDSIVVQTEDGEGSCRVHNTCVGTLPCRVLRARFPIRLTSRDTIQINSEWTARRTSIATPPLLVQQKDLDRKKTEKLHLVSDGAHRKTLDVSLLEAIASGRSYDSWCGGDG